MKSIEEIKIDLTLKMLSGERLSISDIKGLPEDNDLRTFVCSLGAYEGYLYARYIDKQPMIETRQSAYANSLVKRAYIKYLGE